MHRCVSVLLPSFLLVFAVLLVGCGNGDTPAAGPGGGQTPDQPAGGGVRPISVEPGADSKDAPPPPPPASPEEVFKQTVERKRKSVDPEERMGAIEMVLEGTDRKFGGDVLGQLMSDESEDVRALAAEAIGMGKFASGTTALKNSAATDADPLVRSKCLKSLCDLVGKSAAPDLIRALSGDENDNVRAQAASLLGAIGSNLGVDPLIKVLKEDFSESVRVAALSSLLKMKPPRCVDAVIEALEDRNDSVRSDAAKTLGALKNKKAVRPLMNALDEEEESRILLDITEALSKITGVENEFSIDLSDADQEEAVQIWRDWWEENKGNY
jgi:HEAT repeat protein